ncbi:MAG: DNA cytosine methyltransferase [Chloroflexi bacterium]|nr:DNA cytosine methyltransferase [Chloroflexota bacterium]
MQLQAIDLFAGAGGLSLGLTRAGWDVVAACEIDQSAAQTHHLNFPSTKLFGDVREIDFRAFKNIDLLAGGPPCQPFSVAGKQLAGSDGRDMIPEFIRAITEAQPKAFLLENVPGLIAAKNADYSQKIINQLNDLGYDLSIKKVNAADYGVAQKRERILFIGFKKKLDFQFPAPTHGISAPNPYINSSTVLIDVPDCEPNKAIVTYAKNPVLRPSPWAGMLVNGQGRPINPNTPSQTIPATAGGNRTHILDPHGILLAYHQHLIQGGKPYVGKVEGVRRLNIRESARIQSFPDSFEFLGSKSSQYAQIGNAVPPILAQVISAAIKQYF